MALYISSPTGAPVHIGKQGGPLGPERLEPLGFHAYERGGGHDQAIQNGMSPAGPRESDRLLQSQRPDRPSRLRATGQLRNNLRLPEKISEGVGGQRGGRFRTVELPALDLIVWRLPVYALYFLPRNAGEKPSRIHDGNHGGVNAPKALRTVRVSFVNAPCEHFRQASVPERHPIKRSRKSEDAQRHRQRFADLRLREPVEFPACLRHESPSVEAAVVRPGSHDCKRDMPCVHQLPGTNGQFASAHATKQVKHAVSKDLLQCGGRFVAPPFQFHQSGTAIRCRPVNEVDSAVFQSVNAENPCGDRTLVEVSWHVEVFCQHGDGFFENRFRRGIVGGDARRAAELPEFPGRRDGAPAITRLDSVV